MGLLALDNQMVFCRIVSRMDVTVFVRTRGRVRWVIYVLTNDAWAKAFMPRTAIGDDQREYDQNSNESEFVA